MVVVTFLAILEMARESLLDIQQTSPFEPVYIKLRDAEMPALS
jgi:chromatin segregation and condensation protein Rec8/ScpA/Scc1 (kleisin family)